MGVQTRKKKLDRRTVAFIEAVAAAGHTSPDTAATTEQIAVIRNGAVHATRRLLLLNASRGYFVHLKAKPGEHHRWYADPNKVAAAGDAPAKPTLPRDHARRPVTRDTPGVRKGKWTAEENALLKQLWCDEHLATISWRLMRTAEAISTHASRIGIRGEVGGEGRHGLTSIHKLAVRGGYTRKQVLNAAYNLGIEAKVTPRVEPQWIDPLGPKRKKGFDVDEVALILEYLKKMPEGSNLRKKDDPHQKAWGFGKPPSCIKCGRSDRPHEARGLCHTDYVWWTRNGKPDLPGLTPLSERYLKRLPEAAE